MIRQTNYNKKGSALVLIIMVVAVLMILGTALLAVGLTDTKVAVRHQEIVQARNVALTGANVAAERIINIPGSGLPEIIESGGFNINDVPFGEGSYSVTTNYGSADNTIVVSSTGFVKGVQSTVHLTLSVDNPSNLFDGLRQLAENSPLDLKQLLIEGSDENPVNITINWDEDVYGEVADGNGVDLHKDNADDNNITLNADQTELPAIELPDTTDYEYMPSSEADPDLIFEEGINYKINNIYLMNDKKGSVTFNTGDGGEQYIVVDWIKTKIPFTVNGTGTLHIFIKEYAEFQTPVDIASASGSNQATTFFYVLGDDPDVNYLLMRAGYFLNSYIYAPNTVVKVSASNTNIYGAIVADKIIRNDNQGPQGTFQYEPLSDEFTNPVLIQYKRSYYSN